MMSRILTKAACTAVLVFFTLAVLQAQDKSTRKSPPATVKQKVNGVDVKIDYSRPSKKERLIWNGLVKYGQVWRTGANEATTVELSAPTRINGQVLPEGRYALFTIPNKDKWTIIFNKVPDQWGSSSYDQAQDALRFDVKPSYGNPVVEVFEIKLDKRGNMDLMWDDAIVTFKMQ